MSIEPFSVPACGMCLGRQAVWRCTDAWDHWIDACQACADNLHAWGMSALLGPVTRVVLQPESAVPAPRLWMRRCDERRCLGCGRPGAIARENPCSRCDFAGPPPVAEAS